MFSPTKKGNGDINQQLMDLFKNKPNYNVNDAFKSLSHLDLKTRYLEENIERQQVILVKGLKVIRQLEKEFARVKNKIISHRGVSKDDVALIMEEMLNERARQLAPKLTNFSEAQETMPSSEGVNGVMADGLAPDIKYTTKVKSAHNKTITTPYKIIDTKGKGNIEQILIISQDTNFGIYLIVDSNAIYDKDYTYFSTNDDYLQNISCFEDAGKYYLSIRNFYFREGFRFDVNTSSTSTLEEIMVKYTIGDETPG